MKSIQKKFISLLNAALAHRKLPTSSYSYNDLCKLQTLAHIHGLDGLIYSALSTSNSTSAATEQLIKQWERCTVLSSLTQKTNYLQLQNILQAFTNTQIHIIPLKGVYLRALYPLPEFRTMGDVDLLIHHEDYEKIKELLISLYYKEIPDDHPYHKAFKKPHSPSIEVHWALTNGESFNAPAIKAFEQRVWERAIPALVGELETLSFSHEDTCIYLVLHMAKHLTYGGFGLRQMCDLYLLIDHHCSTLDWQYIEHTLKDMGLYPFFSLLLTTLQQLFDHPLNLPLKGFPYINKATASFFRDEVFQSGLFGNGSYSHGVSSLLIHAEKNKNDAPTTVNHFLFPSISKLQEHYPYCKKHYLLIPVAWGQYILGLLFRQDIPIISKLQALLFSNRNKKRRLQLFKFLEL